MSVRMKLNSGSKASFAFTIASVTAAAEVLQRQDIPERDSNRNRANLTERPGILPKVSRQSVRS